MGILEAIDDRLNRLESAIEDVARAVAQPVATDLHGVPLSETEQIWSAGAMDLADATTFSGLSRDQLYKLMGAGELPYSVATRERLVPRLWLVRYLAANQANQQRTKSA